jgi:hypothetical protein
MPFGPSICDMSSPFSEPTNARQAAVSATATGRFHDVVIGASKILHKVELDDRDRDALRWALKMLKSAVATNVIYAMPSSQQLATSGTTILALRRAARSNDGDADVALARVHDGLDAALSGRRDAATMDAVAALRVLFSVVSRFALQSEVVSHGERRGNPAWPVSTTTLHS